jgi:lipoprotein-anchoring transpeptidase ErfK/SrfK
MGVLLMATSPVAPINMKYSAKTALQKAHDTGAESDAAAASQSAQEAYAAGLRDLTIQGQRLPWNRSYSKAEALFGSAIRRAQLAETLAHRRRDDSRDLARRLLGQADSGFDQMEWISSYIPPRSLIHSAIRKARVSYAEAKTLLVKGDYGRAAQAARDANSGIDAAYTRFSRFIQAASDPARSAQYDRWVRETVAWSAANNAGAIVVDKMRRTLTLLVDGSRQSVYRVELGVNGTLDKVVSGDRATPEGMYRVTEKRGPRQTHWYKALLLNYPNEDDLRQFALARSRGLISRRARPGGLIEIHGQGGRGGDWTDGCVALTNRDIDALFDRVSVGTPVTIVGFESDTATGRVDRADRSASRRGSQARASAGAGGLR